MDQKKIGAFMAQRRKALKLTQAQLAERLGVTDKAVSKWETGRCLPDAALIEDVCLSLDVTIHEFFAGERLAEEELPARAGEAMLQAVSDCQRRSRRPAPEVCLFGAGLGLLILAGIRPNWLPWAVAAACCLAAACYLLHRAGGGRLRELRVVSLAALAACIFCAADLGMNYAYASLNFLLPEQYDGSFGITGTLARFAFGDNSWSLPEFFRRFCRAAAIAAAIGAENLALACVSAAKDK